MKNEINCKWNKKISFNIIWNSAKKIEILKNVSLNLSKCERLLLLNTLDWWRKSKAEDTEKRSVYGPGYSTELSFRFSSTRIHSLIIIKNPSRTFWRYRQVDMYMIRYWDIQWYGNRSCPSKTEKEDIWRTEVSCWDDLSHDTAIKVWSTARHTGQQSRD